MAGGVERIEDEVVRSNVARLLDDLGLTLDELVELLKRKYRPTKAQMRMIRNREMRRLYEDEGLTLADLGDEFDLDPGHIGRIGRTEGWTMRPSGPVPRDS